MKFYYIPITLIGAFLVFCIIQKISKNKRPVKRAFISVLSGLFTLLAVDGLSVFTGVYIPISVISVIISIILGIPGVTSMLCVNLLF